MVGDNIITANIGRENVKDIIKDFIDMHDEPFFFILEISTNEKDESMNVDGEIEIFHNDVYILMAVLKRKQIIF